MNNNRVSPEPANYNSQMSESKQEQQIPMQMPPAPLNYQPPPYVADILEPPKWQTVPGQLLNWSCTSAPNPKYGIFGTDSQVVQIMLGPGEFVCSEPGSMLYKAESVKMSTAIGGLGLGVRRVLGGESLFRNKYVNTANVPVCVTLGPSFPAKLIPIDLSRSGTFVASPGLYVGHIGDVHITYRFVRNILAGCFGGAGFLLLKLTGTGTVFLNGGGSVMEKVLAPQEKLLIDTSSLVGFAESAEYNVKSTGGCLACCCGGEGMFNTEITGPGLVIIQSMSLERMKSSLGVYAAAARGTAGGAAAGAATSQ